MTDPGRVALAYYDALNAGDAERLRALIDPDVSLWVEGRTLRGRDALLGFITGLRRDFPAIVTIPRLAGVTDTGAVCELTLMHRSGGADGDGHGEWKLSGRTCDVIEVRAGRVCAVRHYSQEPGEQGAMRRVAELVARGAASDAVFATVASEASRLLDGVPITLIRFVDDRTFTVVAEAGGPVPAGTTRSVPEGGALEAVRVTGRTTRVDDYDSGGERGDYASSLGVRGTVVSPIHMGGAVWGALAASTAGPPLPPTVEGELAGFAELVAVAIANAESRTQLRASRARVVAAADESRRRVQREVHDGAQQRIVQAITTLKLAAQRLEAHDCPGAELVEEALSHAEQASANLRDLVRGILPASLTRGGLRAGVETLLAGLPIDVRLRISGPRMPPEVETTAFFVIAEGLANAAKHSGAAWASVEVGADAGAAVIVVADHGAGGARADGGTGLTGLRDRVEAREGFLRIDSPPGGGTRIVARLPLAPAGA